jgi:hypothetical protein
MSDDLVTLRSQSRLPPPARLALTMDEAAAAIGISRDLFDARVRSDLRLVRIGSKAVVPVRELEKWLERNAAHPIGER